MSLARKLAGPLVVVIAAVGVAGCSTSSPVTAKSVSTTVAGDSETATSSDDTSNVTSDGTAASATTRARATIPKSTTTPGASGAPALTIPVATTAAGATGAPALTIPVATSVGATPGSGQVFTSDAGKFSVAFDATPKETVNPASATSAETHVFQATGTNAVEVVSYAIRSNAGADPANVLKVTVDAIMSASGFVEVSRASTTYQNLPAVEFEATGTDGGTAVRVFGRVVLTDTLLYGALFEFKTGLSGGVGAAHAFIDSFKVLGN